MTSGDLNAAMVETHVSVVFFVGDHAYKLKKAVHFPFADLSTREQRLALCRREVELNRRLAPDVYEGVADVMGPDGRPCDHLVVMRRMPSDRRLSSLVEHGDPSVGPAMHDLAVRLADFHRSADRSPEIAASGTRDAVADRWRGNDAQMRPSGSSCFAIEELDRAMELAGRYLSGRAPLFAQRIALGHVCDGHGDLLADDVFLLDDGPRLLDCIEFDDHLRWLDVVDDLAFLVMDLERLGAPQLGDDLVAEYERASGAPVPRSLLHFYVAYRAQVRAMVAGLRAAQCDDSAERAGHEAEARQLLGLCIGRLERAMARLVMVGGSPGTGKTTVALGLGDQLGWSVLRSDLVRKQLAGQPDEAAPAPFLAGIYTPEMTDRTYQAMVDAARSSLALGESVVIDASFGAGHHRAAVRSVAAETGAELIELRCAADLGVAAERIRGREAEGTDASDADAVIALRLAEDQDPWPESTELATDRPVDAVVAVAVEAATRPPG